jgi:hypothetical protein
MWAQDKKQVTNKTEQTQKPIAFIQNAQENKPAAMSWNDWFNKWKYQISLALLALGGTIYHSAQSSTDKPQTFMIKPRYTKNTAEVISLHQLLTLPPEIVLPQILYPNVTSLSDAQRVTLDYLATLNRKDPRYRSDQIYKEQSKS